MTWQVRELLHMLDTNINVLFGGLYLIIIVELIDLRQIIHDSDH